MKRSIVLILVLGLVAGSVATAQAGKKAKPVKTTLYFHGGSPIGETEIADIVSGLYRKMDTTEPADPTAKSVALVAAGAGGIGTPNPTCAGSPLFPVWVGDVEGKIVGDITIKLSAVGAPAPIDVRVWGMVPGPTACDSQGVEGYVDPHAEVRVDAPAGPGEIEAVLEDVNFPAQRLMVQFTPVLEGPTATRVLYDSTSFISQMEFSCVPPKGSKSCV
ncbi:MAG TPA: hypothetical protein VJ927_10920 [Actinomycetota bacterium]|nr:hypothetical protein [Actinomycetota bacterium]